MSTATTKYLTIRNLSQLKKALTHGRTFEIVEQYLKPEMSGQIRRVEVVQTNGIYSHAVGGCDAETQSMINAWNYGKGSWVSFGKASDWVFDGTDCTLSVTRSGSHLGTRTHKVWTIRVLDDAV